MLKTEQPYFAHESSYVDEPSEIGEGTVIWHFCHVLPEVKIGRKCKIGQNVVIGPRVTIGNNVKIQNNVSIYPGVTLEDDVFCGPSMVFTNIINPRSAIVRNSEEFYGRTLVRQGASIGANATIVCGVTIGRYAFVGAGSVVTRDVGDYALVYGNPARQHGWACYCGEALPAIDEPLRALGKAPSVPDAQPATKDAKTACTACGRGYRLSSGALQPESAVE